MSQTILDEYLAAIDEDDDGNMPDPKPYGFDGMAAMLTEAQDTMMTLGETIANLKRHNDARAAEIGRLTTENRQQRDVLIGGLLGCPDLEAANQDLTCRLAEAEAKLAQTWQPIDTETKIAVTGDAELLVVEESGDQITLEMANGFELAIALPDGVRLGRLVAK